MVGTSDDGTIDIRYFLHAAYEAFMEGDKDKARRYLSQAYMLGDAVIIYKVTRIPYGNDKSSSA